MKKAEILQLLLRYFMLLILGLGNLWIFYIIFTPLTVYPVYWITLLLDSEAKLLEGNLIFFSGNYAEIISACVAGAAYYLLMILNLSTSMNVKKRVGSILFLTFGFLFVNLTRIIIFLILFVNGYQYFDYAHRFVWYFGSTIFVVILWFVNVWIFRIKKIPIYDDVKSIIGELKK